MFEQDHGFSTTLGFRFGAFAYTTDVVELPEHAFEVLAGIDAWIIGTLTDYDRPSEPLRRRQGAPLDRERVGPRHAVLSHLGSELDYAQLAARLPAGVEPAYDGQVIEVGA